MGVRDREGLSVVVEGDAVDELGKGQQGRVYLTKQSLFLFDSEGEGFVAVRGDARDSREQVFYVKGLC